MAGSGVPEIEPTVDPSAAPAPVIPARPLEAFPGEAGGRGLSEIGKAVFETGMKEYRLAVEANAQDAETALQDKLNKLRDEYKQKFGWTAIQAHPEAIAAMNQARDEVLQSIPSKSGRILAANSTLRVLRYAQEGVDSHFEQQNRSYQFGSYKNKQAADLSDIRAYPNKAEEIFNKVTERAKKQYGDLVGDPEATDDEVKRVQGLAASTALKAAADGGVNLDAAMKRWGPMVPESVRDAAERAFEKAHVEKVSSEIFKGLPLVNARNERDEIYGIPSPEIAEKKLREVLKTDPRPDLVEDAVHKRIKAGQEAMDDRAKTLSTQIRSIAQKGGGFDLERVPPSLLSELSAVGPKYADELNDRQATLKHRAVTWTAAEARHAEDLEVSKAKLALRDQDRGSYTLDSLRADLTKYKLTARGEDLVEKEFDKWSKEKPDGYEKTITDTVKKEVYARYGTPEAREAAMAKLTEWAISRHRDGSLSKDYPKMVEQVKTFMKTGVEVEREAPSRPRAVPVQKKVQKWGLDVNGNPIPVGG